MGNSVKGNIQQGNINADYKKGAMIGKGSFATVFEFEKRDTGERVAVKTIRKKQLTNEKEMDKLQNEIEIMKKIRHESIVNFIDVYETAKKFYIVQELCKGGHLLQRCGKLNHYSETQAAAIIYQLADVCKHMHSNGIVHRDLKPENILFRGPPPDNVIKVTDFGMSTLVKNAWEKNLMTPCGTPAFVAPEVIRRSGYNCTCDMWSVGVILYILVSGYPPFYGSSLQKLLVRVTKAKFDFRPKPFTGVSDEVKKIIKGLLVLDTKKRLTPQDLLDSSWCRGDSSSNIHLPQVKDRLQQIAIMNRFKRSVHLAIAACTLKELATTIDPQTPQKIHIEDALSAIANEFENSKSPPAPFIPPKSKSPAETPPATSEENIETSEENIDKPPLMDPDTSQTPAAVNE